MSKLINETFKKHLGLLHKKLNEIGDPENDTISAHAIRRVRQYCDASRNNNHLDIRYGENLYG